MTGMDYNRGLEILPMQAGHLAALAELERHCFSRPWSEAALAEELENPAACFLVALAQGDAVGYAGMHRVLDECYLDNVAVDLRWRRRGVATALMRALLDEARQAGAAFVSLEVRAGNAGAIALYEGLGFREEGRRKDFYSAPKEDALILTKRF